jgi:hypothetical protein
MAAEYVNGWSGIVMGHFKTDIGLTTIKSDGYTFDAYFSIEDLYINGQQCSSRRSAQYQVPIGTAIHFDAVRFNTPFYGIGPNVWYKATLVWIGSKPRFDDDESSYYSDESEDYDPNVADVWCQSGCVIDFCNKNRTAILESTIHNRKTLVALELCRFYCFDSEDDDFYLPNDLTE